MYLVYKQLFFEQLIHTLPTHFLKTSCVATIRFSNTIPNLHTFERDRGPGLLIPWTGPHQWSGCTPCTIRLSLSRDAHDVPFQSFDCGEGCFHLLGCRSYEAVHVRLESGQSRFIIAVLVHDFLQHSGCTQWEKTLKGEDFLSVRMATSWHCNKSSRCFTDANRKSNISTTAVSLTTLRFCTCDQRLFWAGENSCWLSLFRCKNT